jgi:nucleoside-diphosphate kinase
MLSDVSTGIEVVAENANANLQQCCDALQKQFGSGAVKNAVHCSKDAQSKRADMDCFFDSDITTSAIFNNCTCVVIKPHVVAAGQSGQVIDAILDEGFEISAMQMFYMDKPTAAEFLEIYRGVLPEFVPYCEEMTNGPCIVMEVRQENAVDAFRSLAGPLDPEIAKNLRPNTLRARFGCDRVKNAVHCTDLAEDGILESQYFFSVQQ